MSTAALVVGVAGSGAAFSSVRTAGIAGLVAGAMSMAVGEYVSVASQRDVEEADLAMEREALEEHPRAELAELTEIWRSRGLDQELAAEVARQLTAADALAAHARDELGLTNVATARPVQAAVTSAVAFSVGALLPLVAYLVAPNRRPIGRGRGGGPHRSGGARRGRSGPRRRTPSPGNHPSGRRRRRGHGSDDGDRRADRRRPGLIGRCAWQDGTSFTSSTRGTAMTIADEAPATDVSIASATRTAFRTCPLCEAGCGLEITLRRKEGGGEEVQRIRGDQADVFSQGYICPKGSTLKQLHEDPDRVRRPLVKRDGEFVEVSWDEAFAEIEARLLPILERDGRNACAAYLGNPSAHSLGAMLYAKAVLRVARVDQPVLGVDGGPAAEGDLGGPDVRRRAHRAGARHRPHRPPASCSAPTRTRPTAAWPPHRTGRDASSASSSAAARSSSSTPAGRARQRRRPSGCRSARAATRTCSWPWCRSSSPRDWSTLGAVDGLVTGLDVVEQVCQPFTPEAVAAATGIEADTIRRLARELAAAPTACVYGRIGTTTAEFGTVASWLVDVLNALTGNLDRPGGAMFSKAAAGASNTRGTPRVGRGLRLHRHTSRVRGLPETMGELPVVALAEEIDTPGEGQVRALITVAGNPVLSTPNSGRLDAALAGLECMVSIDIYVNETTRHADVILPSPSPLQKSHYDVALLQLALHDVANYSGPVLPLDEDQPDEWEVLARLALLLQGAGAAGDPSIVDDLMIDGMVRSSVGDETSPIHGRDPESIMEALAPRTGPERLLDFLLRTGPYGDGFGADPQGLSLSTLEENPHGIDLGALKPRLPDVLRTPDGMIALAPEVLVADVARLQDGLDGRRDHPFVLIGRRDLRSNNSWMHNIKVLVKGKPRCTMHVHPDDAAALGLADGDPAVVRSRVGQVTVPVEVTDAIRPGVVSIPHGWGHDLRGSQLAVAAEHAGVNSNLLADETLFDVISGNAVLNGIPVEVTKAPGR